MEGHGPTQQGEMLEDQIRRMILSNDSSNIEGIKPRVRLPPPGPTQHPQQHLAPTPQVQHSAGNGYPRPTISAPPHAGHFPPNQAPGQPPHNARFNGPQRQSQRQRRMQPQDPATTQQGPYGPPRNQFRLPVQAPIRPPQGPPIDPNAFQRGGRVAGYYQQAQAPPRQLFNPNAAYGPPMIPHGEQHRRQSQYLEQLATAEVRNVEMSQAERDEKEAFRASLQQIIHGICAADPERLPKVSLQCFGSFASGFASAGSDMDLVIVLQDGTPYTACFSLLEDDLPRVLEKRLLQLGYGARLLSRTRVPIIKICEKPGVSLLDKLREEREKWDDLPNEKKYPHLHPEGDEAAIEEGADAAEGAKLPLETTEPAVNATAEQGAAANGSSGTAATSPNNRAAQSNGSLQNGGRRNFGQSSAEAPTGSEDSAEVPKPRQMPKPWTRERKGGALDFPKTGVGIQSDINFFNPLGLHNTQMLRCYSLCDPRVQPIVLFVKAWAKQRKINSSYSGTLSSYGYVLMVLHYLTNIAQPAVLPNLQLPWRPNPHCTPHGASRTEVDGWVVDFWRNEDEIMQAVQNKQMSPNTESIGSLLAGFFNYYSSQGLGPQYSWTQEVLSLRSHGGLLTKNEKGWVKAVMEEGEGKKIQHRFLFCIEDPFELSHNVARTVTHPGIVAIRDEFRRARRILHAVGIGETPRDGELLAQLLEAEDLEKIAPNMNVHRENANAAVRADSKTASTDPLNGDKAKKQARFADLKAARANGFKGPSGSQVKAKGVDVADKEDFPALGTAKPKGKKTKALPNELDNEFVEISGERAQWILEDLKRKKAEAAAELTATGAAEAVLGDD